MVYLWGECDTHRGATDISTCLFTWLEEVNLRNEAKELVLYCDCCSGQNRNKTMVAMIRHAVNTLDNIEEVTLKFYLTGYSYMPVDSIHSAMMEF